MPGPRNFAFSVAAILLGLSVVLLLAEIGLRFAHIPFDGRWEPTENAVAQFDDELGWSYLPGVSRDVRFESRVRPVHFDERGVRVRVPGQRLRSDMPSILFVGGSYTMGHGLSYEESFVGQFEDGVAPRLQAVNLGVQGYGTDQSWLALRRFVDTFETELVVYTFIPDHVRRNGNYDRRMLYPGARFLGTKPLFDLREGQLSLARSPVRYEDYRTSYVLDLLKLRTASLVEERATRRWIELTRALVSEMDATCRERGISFVVAQWRWTESEPTIFSNLGVRVIDLLEGAPRRWASLKIPGDDHPNAQASRYVSQRLMSELLPEAQ